MRWIGQHIWDLISRFRNTVYFEKLDTSSETNVLVVDGNGKVTKNTSFTGGGGSGGFLISDTGGGKVNMSTSNERFRSPFTGGENSTNMNYNVPASDYQLTGHIVPKDSTFKEFRLHTRGYDAGTYDGIVRVYRKNFTTNNAGTSTLLHTFTSVTFSGTTVLREQSKLDFSETFNAGDEIYFTIQANTGYNGKRFILIGATYWFETT
tara:strand:+ start:1021 stop:1641 length:621 start_codon:yes stop_codon:yes gene_type:complete